MSSVVDQTPYNQYTANGVATVYPYEFQLLSADDLVVTVDDVVIPPSEFSLSGVGVQAGGSVTFNTAPANLSDVLLSRVIALQRDVDYQPNGDFLESTLDLDLNRLWQALQGFFSQLSGGLRAPYPEQLDEMPAAADRANRILTFDADGQPQAVAPTEGTATALAIQLAASGGATQIGFGTSTVAEALAGIVSTTETRTAPAGFSWAGILPTICQAPGRAQWTESVGAYMRRVYSSLIGTGTTYVDPVNGSDANTGGIADPVATLEYALRTLGPTLILCQPGVYTPPQFRSTDVQGAKLKILKTLGPCFIRNAADDITALTWTFSGSGVYYCALTGSNANPLAVLDCSRTDVYGQPVPLAQYASEAAVAAAGRGWYHDDAADRLYVRYDALNVETIKNRLRLVTGSSSTRVFLYGAKLLMEGDWHLEGVTLLPLQLSGARAVLAGEFTSGPIPTIAYTASHGVDALGADTVLQGAWIHRARGDNFHYADDGSLGCRAIEINCRSTFAGDVLTAPTADGTQNASSMHGSGYVLRINGEYLKSYGPDVVDTGTGASWNVGSIAEGSEFNSNSYEFYTTGPTMHLDTCSGLSAKNADLNAITGTIKTFATSYRTSTTSSGGTITTYTPDAP